MTPQEALNCFGMAQPVSKKKIQAQYAALLREWNLRLNSASSTEKRKEAKLLLEGMATKSRRSPSQSATPTPPKRRWQPVPPRPPFASYPASQPSATPRTQSYRKASNAAANGLIIAIAVVALLLIIAVANAKQPSAVNEQGGDHRKRVQPASKEHVSSPGCLVVETHPWSKVYLGSQHLGVAPSLKEHQVRSGKHRIVLTFSKGQRVIIPIGVMSGRRTVVKFNLYSRKAEINGS